MISDLTEITEAAESIPFRGWILFDEDCGFCRALALQLAQLFAKRGFYFEPLQRDWVQQRLQLTREQALEEMRVLTTDGHVFGGAAAVIFLARQLWWAAPFAAVTRFKCVQALLDRAYRWLAAHRTCAIKPGGTRFCASHSVSNAFRQKVGRAEARPSDSRWFALILLPLLALGAKPFLPPWAFMWAMAFAVFFGCKWLTLRIAANRIGGVCPFRSAAYLFAWPGMNASRFLTPNPAPRPRHSLSSRTVVLAVCRILLGIFLLFAIARRVSDPIVAGWTGMVGMILILHFGLFALLSVGWRAVGVDAAPIMDAPLRSNSVAEFWGRRWNAAFNDLALGLVFRPVARRTSVVTGTVSVFAVSGLVHELVISLPAGGGFGLPTAYFLFQGIAIVAQRRMAIFRGWLFTMLVVAAPAFWLFHPTFVRRVILPSMQAIGAL